VESELIHFHCSLCRTVETGSRRRRRRRRGRGRGRRKLTRWCWWLTVLVAMALSLQWTGVVSGGGPSSLCFFFLPLFFRYLCRQCFFPLYSGFVVVLLVAMVVEWRWLFSSLLPFFLFSVFPCYFFHFLLMFLSSSRSCFPFSIFFFFILPPSSVSQIILPSLFFSIFPPPAYLSPLVFIRRKRGREGYYPCPVRNRGRVVGLPLGNHPQHLSPLHFHLGNSRGVGVVGFLGLAREREKERRREKKE